MLERLTQWTWSERGDTLVEVTFALAIMSSVIIGATYVATQAFRLGMTARERTQLVNIAIEQSEALRSFRDNNAWTTFLGYPGVTGVQNVATHNCATPTLVGKQCFSMAIVAGKWTPSNGSVTFAGVPVPPGSVAEVYHPVTLASAQCVERFEVHYGAPPPSGSQWLEGEISVQLVNPGYPGGYGSCQP